MRGNDLMDPREQQEAAALFARPQGGDVAIPTATLPGVTIQDGVITARKVEVERDLQKVLLNIKTLAAMAGDDWYYRFPVKKKGGGTDHIEGPTIKCATNVARLYGNCQVDVRVQDLGPSWLIYARFVDYETGFSLTRPFQADKAKTTINTKDPGRQQEIALAIGVSKATRNVICNALETFTTYAFDEAYKNLVGKIGSDLEGYKQRVAGQLKKMNVDTKRVELNLGRTFDAWLAPDVARVVAEIKGVMDGMATADETWPPLPPPEPKRGDFKQGEAAQPTQAAATPQADAGKPAEQRVAEEAPKGSDPEAKPAATAAEATVEADKPSAADPADEQDAEPRPQKKSWKIAHSIVGQDAKIKAILALLTTPDLTEAEVDDIEKEHAEFIDKLGLAKKSEVKNEFTKAKQAIRQAGAQ